MEQVAWHEPERRAEVLEWFKTVLQNQQSRKLDNDGFSTDANGFIIDSLVNLQATELLPDIKALFEQGYDNPDMRNLKSGMATLHPASLPLMMITPRRRL